MTWAQFDALARSHRRYNDPEAKSEPKAKKVDPRQGSRIAQMWR